jgi:hypothetical protein
MPHSIHGFTEYGEEIERLIRLYAPPWWRPFARRAFIRRHHEEYRWAREFYQRLAEGRLVKLKRLSGDWDFRLPKA